jgi:hypothetical protein
MSSEFFNLLILRSEFEDLVRNFEIPEDKKEGIINNLEWFKINGKKKNRFREGYDRAIEVCEEILNYKV